MTIQVAKAVGRAASLEICVQDGEEDGLQSADVSDEDIDYSDDGVRHWQNFALMNASVVNVQE